MADKPSLYVVERKEVVILVVLFILVTVLSFTLGVKYGETVGRKMGKEAALAVKEQGGIAQDVVGGTLAKEVEKTEVVETTNPHGEPAAPGGSLASSETKTEAVKTEVKKEDASEAKAVVSNSTLAAVDKNSDEHLLNALKAEQIEAPKAKNQALPEAVKRIPSGNYVIQVGSHPSRSEAESQLAELKAKKVSAQILDPFKDKQGSWHRVVLASYKSKAEAEKEAKNLRAKKMISNYFVWRFN